MNRLLLLCGVIGLGILVGLSTSPAWAELMPERALAFTPPSGGAGYWGVREVLRTDDGGRVRNLDDTVYVLNQNAANSGWGQRDDRHRPFIDMYDSGGRGRFPYDQNYGVVNAGYKKRGKVDNIAVVMSGWIEVPETDWYTFDVNSDDGFELSVDHKIVMEYNKGKSTSDVLGQAYLAAGVHPIRVLYWEGGGGAGVEVMAARGSKSSYEYETFNLIGGPMIPAMDFPTPPNVTSSAGAGWDVVVIYDPTSGNLNAAIQNVNDYWGGTLTPTNFAVSVEDTICLYDPDRGDSNIHGFSTRPFPGETHGTDDNTFALGAKGTIHILEEGDYTFVTYGDDGSVFRILGTDGQWGDGGATGGTYTALDDGFRFDGSNNDAYRTIYLAKGDYEARLWWQEGSGKAHIGLFGRFGSYDDGSPFFLLGDTASLDRPEVPAGLNLVVPEPGSLAMWAGMGLLGLMGLAWRRRRS